MSHTNSVAVHPFGSFTAGPRLCDVKAGTLFSLRSDHTPFKAGDICLAVSGMNPLDYGCIVRLRDGCFGALPEWAQVIIFNKESMIRLTVQ